MKTLKVSLVIIAIFILLCTCVFAQSNSSSSCTSSGLITSDTQICTGTGCRLCAVEVITDGTNAATCATYNGTTNSGVKLFSGGPVAGVSRFGGVIYTTPVRANKGIFVDITGTGAGCIVSYDDK